MERKFKITDARGGSAITVRVVTRAKHVEIAGIDEDSALRIRLTESPASSDAANQQLVEFIAHRLGVAVSQVEIVAGAHDKDKIISVEGVVPEQIESLLQPDTAAE
jgi:uncharacterized protein (TIGR00251 family)